VLDDVVRRATAMNMTHADRVRRSIGQDPSAS
jgi:hypothetical protein